MLIYGAVIIAIISIIILYTFFKTQTEWWEYLLPIAGAIIPALILKLIFSFALAVDTEYWTGYVETAAYFEDWNEEVTRVETYTDSKGNLQTRTVTDIVYHPPYWELKESNGISLGISKADYNYVKQKFQNEKFQDLGRWHHTNDGDKYFVSRTNDKDRDVIITTTHLYRNKVAATNTVFDYEEVDPKEWGLFEYPSFSSQFDDNPCLSRVPIDLSEARELAHFNAIWGKRKQIRVWVLIFNNQTIDTAYAQEAYWKGGNKNELVVCLGVSNNTIQWNHVFSWTDREDFKVGLRNHLNTYIGQPISLSPTVSWLQDNIGLWERKQFKDFDYITVPVPLWGVILNYALVIVSSVGVIIYVVHNGINSAGVYGDRRFGRSLYGRSSLLFSSNRTSRTNKIKWK